jgi:hypothetical protein
MKTSHNTTVINLPALDGASAPGSLPLWRQPAYAGVRFDDTGALARVRMR